MERVLVAPRADQCRAGGQTKVDDHDYTEAATRDLSIDLLLAEAGWPLTDARDACWDLTQYS